MASSATATAPVIARTRVLLIGFPPKRDHFEQRPAAWRYPNCAAHTRRHKQYQLADKNFEEAVKVVRLSPLFSEKPEDRVADPAPPDEQAWPANHRRYAVE
jgi:hypothetical protein